jgi:HipA-like protein
MRQAIVKVHGIEAGILTETEDKRFRFTYHEGYKGAPVSLTMPVNTEGANLPCQNLFCTPITSCICQV